jgi:two-component system copper resistance phosphate regulon response regulator CusR
MTRRAPHARARILVVEDERKVANAIGQGLSDEGYDVVVALSGEDALSSLRDEPFEVVLLDLALPGVHGLDVLSTLRQNGSDSRVLILTARDALEDRIVGLESGADDYLVKPFAFAELLARIRALLRRGRTTDTPVLELSDLRMDLVTRTVTRRGEAIELTSTEFELLECLLRSAGAVVSRDTLVREVWRETSRSTTLDNVIDVHIARLRRKVDLGGLPPLIRTVRGVGFIASDGA